ncbi:hypothetical protein HW555_006770 [Spodoptera exigua]|uniref:Ty3 transposon capsid-like protein domain-containing protein n=1 Tax=Spodoptera exigua TaxID=7107 RepID=A0A835L9N8_SPOEX|nr:hypothetical protein HW555_006770 [Spodoptera exigua]
MPRRRKSLYTDANESGHEDSEPEQSSNITMPQDVLAKLLTSIQQSQAEFCQQLLREVRSSTPLLSSADASTSIATANAAAAIMKSTANFSKCTSKFSGSPEESVDNFIDAMEVYKSCLNISDENALLGMSMLLTSSAGTWWQGVKGTTKTWEEAITRLRSAYGERRPPFRIYIELFSQIQGTENTDLFISKVRALFAKLPQGDLCERVELDMAYGLLDRRIRKRVDRATVTTFEELLKKARAVEDSLNESQNGRPCLRPSSHSEDRSNVAASVEPARVRTYTSSTASRSSAVVASGRMGDSATEKTGTTKLFCVYCKRSGHTKETCEKLVKNSDQNKSNSDFKKDIKCYGCGAANIIKSKCPKCNANNVKYNGHSAFYSLTSARDSRAPTDCFRSHRTPRVRSDIRSGSDGSAPRPHHAPTPLPRGSVMFGGTAGAPTCPSVERHASSLHSVRGENGTALLDSTAKSCVAGHTLYALLKAKGHPMSSSMENVKLADGVLSVEQFDLPFEKVSHQADSVPRSSVLRIKAEKERDRRKDYADKGRKPVEFDVGDQVLVKSHVLSNAAIGLSDVILGRSHALQLTGFVNSDSPPLPIVPKRSRDRPRHVKPVSADQERVPARGRLHEPEGECIADNVSERLLSPGRKRSNRGKPPDRYSPAR